jgi:hypothetical protein
MIIDLNLDIAFFSQKTNLLLQIYMQVLHNLVNGPQRLTSSRPNPKMQYPIQKWYIECKKHVNQYMIIDLNTSISLCSQKTSPTFLHTYMWVLQKLANVVMLFILGHMCTYCFCGENPITIFNTYVWLLRMWVKQTHISHKWQIYGSQNIWVTMHMIHKTYAYGSQCIW